MYSQSDLHYLFFELEYRMCPICSAALPLPLFTFKKKDRPRWYTGGGGGEQERVGAR